jgi:uncharacterized protein (DUF58 family)
MLSLEETRQLDRLGLSAAGTTLARASGSRLARARGFGTECHDFRRYQPGDDPRGIEWSVDARLGQLVVRTYRADAILRVHLLIDASASMALGEPDKMSCARRVAALLAYLGVRDRDAVGLATFDENVRSSIAPAAGRSQLRRLMTALETITPGGSSSLTRTMIDYASAARGPGVVVVVSDFFDPAGAWEGLHCLLHRGLTPAIVQVLAPEELEPSIEDELDLADAEQPDAAPVTVTPAAVRAYVERLNAVSAELGEFCVRHGLPWLRLRSSASVGDMAQACLHAGLVGERA